MEDETVNQDGVVVFDLFPEAVRDDARALTHIGYLEKSVTFCGHEFVLRTLRPYEKAAISIVVLPWRNTLAEAEIYANSHVGLALTSVDGDAAFCPQIGPDITSFARARLNYVTGPEGWFQPTLDFLYTSYNEIEKKAFEALEALQNLAERSPQPSPSSADSLTVPDTSPDETPLATFSMVSSS